MNMIDISKIDYSVLDRPEVLQFLFHPRPEPPGSYLQTTGSARLNSDEADILIPVDEEVAIGARFHMAKKSDASILFFHGNGEIVADYDELGPVFGLFLRRLSGDPGCGNGATIEDVS